MKKIILTVGPPAIGKSTWANLEVKKSRGRIKRISKDNLREMLDCGEYSPENEKLIDKIVASTVELALRKGYDVIFDATNLNSKSWQEMCKVANKVGNVEVVEKHFDIPNKKVLYSRDEARENSVGKNVIDFMWDKWTKYVKHESYYAPNIDSIRIQNTKRFSTTTDKPNAVIFDIDGTLALFDTRSPYDMEQALNDESNKPLLYLKGLFPADTKFLIVTGRNEKNRKLTEDWLELQGIQYDHLLMRPAEREFDADDDIKIDLYTQHIKDTFNILACFDDRNRVVDMWRIEGIPTYQVWWGNF